jgi:hypothetical protein
VASKLSFSPQSLLWRWSIRGTALLISLPSFGGCEGKEQTHGPPLVTDSAGVEIVLNQGPTWARGEGWRLSRRPVFSIGDSENDDRYQFGSVSDTHRFPDGKLAVVDGQVAEIKFYDPNGVYLPNFSSRGEGPGEFQRPGHLQGYRADSILISDFAAYRYLFYDSEEVYGRAIQAYEALLYWPQEGELRADGGMLFDGVFSDGSLLLRYPEVVRTTGSGMRRGMEYLVRLSPDGTAVDTVAVYPGDRYFREAGYRIPMHGHFRQQVRVALHDDEIFIGNGEEFRIDVLDPEGALIRSIRVDAPNPPLSGRLKESFLELERRRVGGSPEATSDLLEGWLSLPIPEHLPAYCRILADELGNLWVGHWPEEEYSANPDRYTVFDASGTMMGSVSVPLDFVPRQIGSDWILGTRRDEYDVSHVQLYDLVKPGAS